MLVRLCDDRQFVFDVNVLVNVPRMRSHNICATNAIYRSFRLVMFHRRRMRAVACWVDGGGGCWWGRL